MASITLPVDLQRFPDGVTVSAYKTSNWSGQGIDTAPQDTAPQGTADTNATVTNRAVSFTGLAENQDYYGVYSAGGSVYRYFRFHVGSNDPDATSRRVQELNGSRGFKGSPTIRNRAFATVMASPPTVTVGGASTALSGSIAVRLPTEMRVSNAALILNSSRYAAVKGYGYAGDVTLSPRSMGTQIVCYEFDTPGRYWEFVTGTLGIRYWLWVNDQPATSQPVQVSSAAGLQHILVDHGSVPATGSPNRIMLMVDSGSFSSLFSFKHKQSEVIVHPSTQASGQLVWPGDSVPEGNWANTNWTIPSQNVQYPHGSFVFQLGWMLGLWDVCQGLSMGGRGVLMTNASNGNLPYQGNLTYDLPLIVRSPSGDGTCIVLQSSTNDKGGGYTTSQVQAGYETAIASIVAPYPDATIIGVGSLGAPPDAGMAAYDAALLAALTAHGIGDNFVATAGVLFTGTGNEGSAAGDGNSDIMAPSDDHVAHPGKGPPHPNALGHARIARFLAPQFARILGINMGSDSVWTVT